MLPFLTVPAGLAEVLAACRGAFGAPSYLTFTALVTGVLGATGSRTVTGMWSAAGLAGRLHWSRAHWFFAYAAWDPDNLGLLLAHAVVAAFAPRGAALTVAVDDTLFHRFGKKVYGAAWQHDGSAKGRDGIGRGNCFVVAGIVVHVPFLCRAVFLPVLFRLHVPNSKKRPNPEATCSKTEAARQIVNLLARAFPERKIHVVADALYRGPAWRDLPGNVTFTSRLASNAVLYDGPPPPTGRRGRPALKGKRLGTPADLAATARFTKTTVTRYGVIDTVWLAEVDCLWWGSMHRTPVRVVLIRDLDSTKPYDIALVTTDLAAAPETIAARYSDRWSEEQTIKDCKELLGAGDAASRLPAAVRRTVPFTMCCLTILVLWYAKTGDASGDVAARRSNAPWYRKKTTVSVADMLIAFRRARITGVHAAQTTLDLFDHAALTSTPTAA
jgi:transposase